MLDDLDRKILALLDKDARTPINKIAIKLGISRQLANNRLHHLEKNNLILGHFTIFDSGVLGFDLFRILIRLSSISKEEKISIIDYLKNHPNIMWLGEVGGRWDIAANFSCHGHNNFNLIYEELSDKFGSFVNEAQILVYVDVFDYCRSYLYEEGVVRKIFYHRMINKPNISIDALDIKIIKHMSADARISNTKLAKLIDSSRFVVKHRIEKMIKNKFIIGFRTFPRLNKIGYQSHMVFLKINKMNKERETELYYYLQMLKQVTFVVKHLEAWRIGLEIETKNEEEFQDILMRIRSQFNDLIADYDSFPLFKDHVINYFPRAL